MCIIEEVALMGGGAYARLDELQCALDVQEGAADHREERQRSSTQVHVDVPPEPGTRVAVFQKEISYLFGFIRAQCGFQPSNFHRILGELARAVASVTKSFVIPLQVHMDVRGAPQDFAAATLGRSLL